MPPPIPAALCAAIVALAISACGSSSSSSSGASQPGGSGSGSGSNGGSGSAALSADATSAATGDIPDNQVFLVFEDKSAGYSIKYPEGWTQTGAGADVTFRDKNNLVHLQVMHHGSPTRSSVAAQLAALKRANPTLSFHPPQAISLGGTHAVKAIYTTQSPPNPVTGKSVRLTVDRYEIPGGGRVAMVDLGTPVGVDNVDAYRMMIQSFKWR
jgi:PsbP